VNPTIDAELSVGYAWIEALDAALPGGVLEREALPWEAGFWPASVSWRTGDVEGCEVRRCLSSILARMRRSSDWPC
jgi:hypothetical protein